MTSLSQPIPFSHSAIYKSTAKSYSPSQPAEDAHSGATSAQPSECSAEDTACAAQKASSKNSNSYTTSSALGSSPFTTTHSASTRNAPSKYAKKSKNENSR